MNAFEASARAKKVRAMVLYFDVEFARLDVDPLREADRVIAALRDMTDEQLTLHFVLAGQRPSRDGKSGQTFADIIAVYGARAFESENDDTVATKRIGGLN
jgi:hypothetical protein